jgi:hypothetical protein
MSQKIRIITRASLFELRKQQYIEAGYQIEEEQISIKGMCSFTAVRKLVDEDGMGLEGLTCTQVASAKRFNKTKPRARAKNSGG